MFKEYTNNELERNQIIFDVICVFHFPIWKVLFVYSICISYVYIMYTLLLNSRFNIYVMLCKSIRKSRLWH